MDKELMKKLESAILSNKIRCKKCGDTIESEHRHDFKWCKCESCAVDGGKSYLKRSAKSFEDVEELSVIESYKANISEVMQCDDGASFRISDMEETVVVIDCEDGVKRLFEKETGRRILMASDYLNAKYELMGWY